MDNQKQRYLTGMQNQIRAMHDMLILDYGERTANVLLLESALNPNSKHTSHFYNVLDKVNKPSFPEKYKSIFIKHDIIQL